MCVLSFRNNRYKVILLDLLDLFKVVRVIGSYANIFEMIKYLNFRVSDISNL